MKRFFISGSFVTTLFYASLSFSSPVLADVVTLKFGHPDSYVVKKGDTLWDISATFLKEPWLWPKLWGKNPQIANPHLIYPSDKLTLVFIDGKPKLAVKPHLKKRLQGQIIPKSSAIAAVDLSLIRPYITQNRIVNPEWMQHQPMVLGGESASRHHVTGNIIYVKGVLPLANKVGLYTAGKQYRRQQNGELLGQEAILTAVGRVLESADISKVKIINSYRETKAGFRVLSIDDDLLLNAYFMPKPANVILPTKILNSVVSIREMGKLDIAYIDRGYIDGVDNGDVFAIYRKGDAILLDTNGQPILSNNYTAYNRFVADIGANRTTKYQLPDIYHGNIMVFKTFDKMSIGIIMANERSVRANDNLVTPKVEQL